MPESEEHAHLVTMLHDYIADRFCGGSGHRVLTDSEYSSASDRPPSFGGHIPDAYMPLGSSGSVALGEAKSLRDLENTHTEAQITAFLRRCSSAEGSVFVVAVPWPVERLALALVKRIQTKEELSNVEVTVLSDANPNGLHDIG